MKSILCTPENTPEFNARLREEMPEFQYADEHALLCDVIRNHGGRVAVFRNHSKVMAGYGADGFAFAAESSANVNTNPRAEQTAIHCDRGLADFYRDFFDGIRSFNRDFDDVPPWSPAE